MHPAEKSNMLITKACSTAAELHGRTLRYLCAMRSGKGEQHSGQATGAVTSVQGQNAKV